MKRRKTKNIPIFIFFNVIVTMYVQVPLKFSNQQFVMIFSPTYLSVFCCCCYQPPLSLLVHRQPLNFISYESKFSYDFHLHKLILFVLKKYGNIGSGLLFANDYTTKKYTPYIYPYTFYIYISYTNIIQTTHNQKENRKNQIIFQLNFTGTK